MMYLVTVLDDDTTNDGVCTMVMTKYAAIIFMSDESVSPAGDALFRVNSKATLLLGYVS